MPSVIVIGNSYSTRLGVIRAVASLECEVTIIHVGFYGNDCPSKPLDGYSKYVNDILYFNRQEGEKGLVKLLLEKCAVKGQNPIIIPTSDFAALAIDEEIKKHFSVPYIHNEINSIGYWMDKANQKELALRVGLNAADSVVIEKKGKGYVMPDSIRYPCFTKPISSIGAGKKCLQRCDNAIALQKVLGIAEKNGIQKILVEDYIDIEQEYAILGFSDGKDVVIPGIIEFQRECQSHKGIAMTGKVMPIDGFEDLIGKFSDFIRQMGFVGIFDIDFLESNGIFYFDEMNLRIGGSGVAILNAGVNLPAMFVKAICRESTDDMAQAVTHAASFVNEKMVLDDFAEGCMSFRKYRKQLTEADILFIKNETDVAPYKIFEKQVRDLLFSYKRIAKRVLHVLGIRYS